MGRINGNFLNELLTPKSGGGNPIANGGFSGNSALYLQANQRQNPATAQVGADDKNKSQSGDGGADKTFWVGKSADAKKIGENLLRENFGFEEIDVQAYKTLYGDFKIFDEKQCATNEKAGKECKAATTEQIKKWRTSADGKKVAVDLPESMVKFLRDFRQTRLIERRVTEIADPQLRAQTEKDLRAAVTQSGQARADAFLGLRNALENNSPDGKKAAEVIKLIVNLPENKENPFTQILLAKIELKEIYSGKTVMFNPKDVSAIEQRISRAADLAAGYSDATRTRDPKKAVSRAEAQTLNEEAARLANQFGKPDDARFYTLRARFYAVDDAERNKYEAMRFPQMTTLPRHKDLPELSVSAANKDTLALEQFQRENPTPDAAPKELSEDPQKRQISVEYLKNEKGEKVLDKDGKPIIIQQSNFQIEGSMKPSGVQYTDKQIHLDEKGRPVKQSQSYGRSMPYTSKQTVEREEINSGGINGVSVTAGAVGAIEEVNKWTPFLADLYYNTTARKIAVREKLEKAAFDANNYPVPPKPEKIQRMKRDLLGYRFETQSEFQRVQWTMKRLEDLSYAFWNR